jgi:hypothetical protein
MPISQISPAGQVTPVQPSTQPVGPQTWPAGQPVPHALARQTPSALQVWPAPQLASEVQRATHMPESQASHSGSHMIVAQPSTQRPAMQV